MELNHIYIHSCMECPYFKKIDEEYNTILKCERNCFLASKIDDIDKYKEIKEMLRSHETHLMCDLLYADINESSLNELQAHYLLSDEAIAILSDAFKHNREGFKKFSDWEKNNVKIMTMDELLPKMQEIEKNFERDVHEAIDIEHIDIGLSQELILELMCEQIGDNIDYFVDVTMVKCETVIIFFENSNDIFLKDD